MNEKLETITIEVSPPKGKSFFINTWYRPPDASMECFDWYENCIIDMGLENKETILIGDFNCGCSRLVMNKTPAQALNPPADTNTIILIVNTNRLGSSARIQKTCIGPSDVSNMS